jgi:hypothetical protein
MSYKGQGVGKDYRQAARLYQKACKHGYAPGCLNLGVLYIKGQGVAKNERQAALLYQKACQGGSSTGCFNLGVSYAKGRGVQKDYGKAAEPFAKPVEPVTPWPVWDSVSPMNGGSAYGGISRSPDLSSTKPADSAPRRAAVCLENYAEDPRFETQNIHASALTGLSTLYEVLLG